MLELNKSPGPIHNLKVLSKTINAVRLRLFDLLKEKSAIVLERMLQSLARSQIADS